MIKINDTKDLKLERLRKGQKSSSTTGSQFAELLQQAEGEVSASATPTTVTDLAAISPQLLQGLADLVPKEGRPRGEYILAVLKELQQDILAGQGTTTIERLRVALQQEALDRAQLPPRLREILDEIDLRAHLEIAKLTPSADDESST